MLVGNANASALDKGCGLLKFEGNGLCLSLLSKISRYSEAVASSRDAFKIYRNGRRIADPLRFKFLPTQTDTVTHYTERLKLLGCTTFLLYISQIPQTLLSQDEIALVAWVLAKFGIEQLSVRIDFEVFFGWYGLTPGGVHSEQCSNFHCVISGNKEMQIWYPDSIDLKNSRVISRGDELYLASRPEIQPDQIISAGAGNLIYWPTRHWHVGSASSPTLAFNIAVYPQ